MKKMERIEYLIQCWELGTTICQGLSYLAQHPWDESVREDVRNGGETLRSTLESVDIFLKNSVWNALPDGGMKAAGLLSAALSEALSGLLLKELNTVGELKPETAQALFRFYDAAPCTSQTICQLLFNVCQMIAATAPQESFSYTLKLLEKHPKLFSDSNFAHPGYVYRPSDQRTFSRCPVCGGEGTPYYRSLAYLMQDFSYPDLPVKLWMKCESCGNLYSWKYPEGRLVSPEDSRMIWPEPGVYLTAAANSSILALWCDVLNTLGRCTSGRSLLEVGIGHGELLAVALEMGYQPDAVEISEETAQKVANLLGIPIWRGDFLDYTADKTYSMITMGDVLEHITDPGRALRNAHQLLREDGVLWLSTPNFESAFSRLRKFEDPMWMEPHHITYFSRCGLESLADSCGFTLETYMVSRRYNGSMELIFRKKEETEVCVSE